MQIINGKIRAKIGGNIFKRKTVHAIWYLKIPEICKSNEESTNRKIFLSTSQRQFWEFSYTENFIQWVKVG